MNTDEQILTDEMIAEIKSLFDRYPSKQAVTLPALHVVNDRLRHVQRTVSPRALSDSGSPEVNMPSWPDCDKPGLPQNVGVPFSDPKCYTCKR